MFAYHFMVNAYRAGTIVAVLAGVVGWFMVLRRETFAGHTLALVGFPGAAGAAWLGISVSAGYYGSCGLASVAIAALPSAPGGHRKETAGIGVVQAFALAAGLLFISLSARFLNGVSDLLFGTFLGITDGQVEAIVVVAVATGAVLAVAGRPLFFASMDPEAAAARRIPVRAVAMGFLLVLGLTVAAVSQITGALLVFALLVLPPATAQRLTPRPAASLSLGVALAVLETWAALAAAYYSAYPVGFWLTTIAFGAFVLASVGARLREGTAR